MYMYMLLELAHVLQTVCSCIILAFHVVVVCGQVTLCLMSGVSQMDHSGMLITTFFNNRQSSYQSCDTPSSSLSTSVDNEASRRTPRPEEEQGTRAELMFM